MLTTLIVCDEAEKLLETEYSFVEHSKIINFDQYLQDYPKRNERRTRVINLCDTASYLSKGYYCSLLAEARQHRALPSVKIINTLRAGVLLEQTFSDLESDQEHYIFFGESSVAALRKVGQQLFQKYSAPILKLKKNQKGKWVLSRASFTELDSEEEQRFLASLDRFTKNVWRKPSSHKRFRWDMAILVNAEEASPPSNKEALSRFVKAASKHGIHAELVEYAQAKNIAQYDALFIRETTAIDHHTYQLARAAEDQGVVVIDDPDSILRCCNKIYLQDAFSYQGVPSLKATVVSSHESKELERLEQSFSYPMVLKMPEGSFSRGVFKVADRSALKEQLKEMFKESALVLVQEYLYTDFDWRIGVLNGRALYACRYLMARNHWQIYNHGAKRFKSGDFECMPTFEVPKVVLEAALKAARIIGNGLYGVDVKQKDNKAYVIEVNDNPSIEYKIEDRYLGDELYMQIMNEFQIRLEARGK